MNHFEDETRQRRYHYSHPRRLDCNLGEILAIGELVIGICTSLYLGREYGAGAGIATLGYSIILSCGIMRFSSYLENKRK